MKKIIIVVAVLCILGFASAITYLQFSEPESQESDLEDPLVNKLNGNAGDIIYDAKIFTEVSVPEENAITGYSSYASAIAGTLDIAVVSYDDAGMELSVKGYTEEALLQRIITDTGFVNDVQNFCSLELDKNEIYSYVVKYLETLLEGQNLPPKESFTVQVKRSGSLLESNQFILDYCSRFSVNFFDDLIDAACNNQEDDDTEFDANFLIKNCMIGRVYLLYVYAGEEDRCKCALQIDEVITGNQAIEYLSGISKTNASLVLRDSDSICVVRYRVSNLEDKDIVVPDNMVYLDERLRCYKNYGFRIIGVSEQKNLAANGAVDMVAALVTPKDVSAVYWRDKYSHCVLKFSLHSDTSNDREGDSLGEEDSTQ